jgi:hypothetical protein
MAPAPSELSEPLTNSSYDHKNECCAEACLSPETEKEGNFITGVRNYGHSQSFPTSFVVSIDA